jgi:hypothetical protein
VAQAPKHRDVDGSSLRDGQSIDQGPGHCLDQVSQSGELQGHH